uniref:RING-type domain-containing protein n=1 Tax=Leersia perrieri TaxID=77586 RepID=A0A0D9W0J3_9ORYZ
MAAAAESNSFACPICLESFLDEAYLDTCFHSFCYKCICQWVNIVSSKHPEPLSSVKCPLCKEQAAKDRSSEDCNGARREDEDDILVSPEPWSQTRKREIERLSDAHELISQLYSIGEIIGNNSSVQQFWKQRKYLRKNIWLQTWLRQEIQALTQDEDVDAIIFHIHGVIESFMKRQEKEHASKMTPPEKKREEFKCLLSDAARPFLLGRTERFVAEVELFLVSHLNIDAYSKLRVQRLKESTSHVSREQDVLPLPQDRSLEDHYLYFVGDETYCSGEI